MKHHVRGFHGAMNPTRALRQADSPYRRRPPKQRTRVEWWRVLMVTGAALLVLATLLYKFAGPA
jgi:hypothetical protein